MNLNFEINDELYDTLNIRLSKQKIKLDDYLGSLIKRDLLSIVILNNGYYLDTYTKKLYTKKDEEVPLTKIQYAIVKLLADNKNEIVSVEKIMKECWEKKEVSIFTARNMIKQIRDKTCYKFIKNYSNKGYEISV